MSVVTTRGDTIVTTYPCCGHLCRLRIVREHDVRVQAETVERRHFCDRADVNGTLWRITWQQVANNEFYLIHEIEFLDLASRDAVQQYGNARIPTRAEQR